MKDKTFPIGALLIATATFVTSITIAVKIKGAPWNTVPILELATYGGITNAQIARGEWWRLFTSHLVHVKQGHMLFNVISLFVLGAAFERITNLFRFFLLWLVSGIVGTYASIINVNPPWDIGTGASQAVIGIAGGIIVSMMRGHSHPKWLKMVLWIVLALSFFLDLIFVHYPKPGHLFGLFAGILLGFCLVPKQPAKSSD